MGNILLRDQDGYIVAFEQFDCRSFARFPGKEVRATVLTYIDPFSCNRRNERCPPNYRSGRCRITRATGGSSTCFDNVHIVRELAIELWNLYNFQFRFGVKLYECEYLCQVIICLHAASAMYINLDCNINVRSHLIFYFLSFFFFLFQFHEIVEKRSKEQECVTTSINSRITSICRLMSTSISIPIVDYAFITAYRAFPVSCSSFSSIIFLVHAFSIIVDYRGKIPVSLASLFLVSSFPLLPLLSAIFLYPPPSFPRLSFHYFVAAFSASVNRWIFHFSLSFSLFNVFFLFLRKFH